MPQAAPVRPADPLVALADQCVQCGLCLPACPTYALDLVEAESPRGRIALARAWALETLPATAIGETHLDQCLGCRRCEVVCPADVQYGALLVEARSRQRSRRVPGFRQRMAEGITARPSLLRGLIGLYRLVFPALPAAWRPLPRPASGHSPGADAGSLARTHPPRNKRIAIFVGCIAGPYERALRAAVLRLCATAGMTVVIPDDQTCCGSLHAHAGNTATADTLATRNRAAFSNTTTVLTLASGCHESIADSLRAQVPTVDAIIFLNDHGESLRFRATTERVALHLPCTQRNVVKSDGALRALLARVPGLQVVALDAGLGCCGAAGTQMLVDPARAARFRQPLLEQFAASGATRLLSANIGCRLHFANATRLPVQHPLEFLAECLDIEACAASALK